MYVTDATDVLCFCLFEHCPYCALFCLLFYLWSLISHCRIKKRSTHATTTIIFLCLQDLLDSDWASVRSVLEQADILVIKYSVNDKLAFQQVRNGYAPRLRPLLRHWGVPVILVAVGARLNGER